MHHKNDRDPDGNELPGDRDQLQPEPVLTDLAFFNDQPGIVKRNEAFQGSMPAFLNMPYIPTCQPIVPIINRN
jgi:hypothetical protein